MLGSLLSALGKTTLSELSACGGEFFCPAPLHHSGKVGPNVVLNGVCLGKKGAKKGIFYRLKRVLYKNLFMYKLIYQVLKMQK